MDEHTNLAIPLLELVLVVFLWLSAWAWWRFAKRPEEYREAVAYSTATVFGFAGLVVVFLFLMHI